MFYVGLVSNSSTWLLADCLRTLSYLLYDTSSKYSLETHKSVLGVVIPLTRVSISDLDVRRQAINCLVNITKCPPDMLSPYCKTIYSSMYQNFELLIKGIAGDTNSQKMLFSVMKTLVTVIQTGDKVHLQDTEKIVSQLSRLMFFGTIFFPVSPSLTSKKGMFNISNIS